MADVGTVLGVVQTLFAALESPMLKKISSILGYRSELKDLKNTVSTVRAVLLDAETKKDHEISNEARDWIEKLKCAVYDADDLLDEFITLAEQKQLLKRGKISEEVNAFFRRFNQLGVAYSMSCGVKTVRKQLDVIARDHTQFGFGLANSESIRKRDKESCSYVYEHNIIGRQDDKKAVIDMLLDPSVEGNVSYVTIVGIGGLGKTALAQLVYNDQIIENEFPLRMWVCVSDQDPKHLDIKSVLCTILESKHESCELDWVQRKVRNEIEGKRYLLVLDDVWSEDRGQFLKLGEFLMGGARGSRVMVTTRSKITASVIRNGFTHKLQGLSDESSWYLFERLAFDKGQGELNPDLVEVGKEIVKKCANVPLAIRMVGTLLYGKSKVKWRAILRNGLAKVRQDEGDITHVLKLSYYHLDTCLKSCFSYCAIFPKDYVMDKLELISLWIAQGYVEPLDTCQSKNDLGEEYFSILLRRCFFQDVQTDPFCGIVSFKMHDLMHDIAQEVAGNEICEAHSDASKVNRKTRHVFGVKQECTKTSLPRTKIRTYLRGLERESPPMGSVLENLKHLRALEWRCSGINKLSFTIGRLLHLRYLDLSGNENLERLPKEVTKLHNLQTLLLSDCFRLKELPSDLSKLVKLIVLDIEGCDALTFMPCGMKKLTELCILPLFIVGEVSSSNQKQGVGRLDDIQALTHLKAFLRIQIHANANTYVKENGKGGFLNNKENLTDIEISWSHDGKDDEKGGNKALAEALLPHPNLKRLHLNGYYDVEKPSWATDDNLETSLPNLVSLNLCDCEGIEDLPLLGRLRSLKVLVLMRVLNLAYVETGSASRYESETRTIKPSFFPSLLNLWLEDLPKLKGWWKVDADMLPSFHRLSNVKIIRCPNLTSMPLCTGIELLTLKGINTRLQIMKTNMQGCCQLISLDAYDAGYFKILPIQAFQTLSKLTICNDKTLKNIPDVGEVFQSCSSSLQTLEILRCRKLKTISGALVHLTSLHSLTLLAHPCVVLLEEDDPLPWTALNGSLRSLKMNYLPKGIRHLTSLKSLTIEDCSHLTTIPEWITCLSSLQYLKLLGLRHLKSLPSGLPELTSLRQLEIRECSTDLSFRCRRLIGLDWPKIQHIPCFLIYQ